MNKRLLTIQVLKEKMTTMQSELQRLQKLQKKPQRTISKTKQTSLSPIRKTSTDKRYKNPTFWTGNPILGEQNPYFSQKNISPSKKVTRNPSFKTKSPIIEKIKKDVDINFYQSVPSQEKQNKINFESFHQTPKGNFNKSNKSMIFNLYRNTPKVEKKKTFEVPKKDPILNPEPQKFHSKKITHPIQRSPSNMFLQNPNSNPNLYFTTTKPVTLSPKANNNRNKSPGLKLILSNSLESLSDFNKTPKSNKKHYNKYFEQNFESKWNLQW